MLSDSRGPADLAAIAALAAGQGVATTQFEIVHRAIGASDALPLSVTEQTQGKATAQETLGFDVPGAGFEIRTWSSKDELPARSGVVISDDRHVRGDDDERLRVVSGSGALNPSFLYNTTSSTEVLLTLRHGRWAVDFGDCLMVTQAVRILASAAAVVGRAPILFMQSPVAPFRSPRHKFRYDGSGEQPRWSRGLAVRVSIGVDHGRPESRIEMLNQIASEAAEWGFGIQVADDRLARARGDWWTVLATSREVYEHRKESEFGSAPAGRISSVQLLTFVGPARTGSTLALVSDLQARGVGIVAVSVSALQELAFINLVVPVAPGGSVAATSNRSDGLVDGLASIGGVAMLTAPRETPIEPDLEAARDYHLIQSGPVPFHGDDNPHRPLWISWELPGDLADGRHGIPEIVREILLKSPHCIDVSLDYFRSRILPSGAIRGRAKVAVALPKGLNDKLAEILTDLCEQVQIEGKRTLMSGLPQAGANLRLRVVWRERWLDRWQLVL
jgi:hypothetical protein